MASSFARQMNFTTTSLTSTGKKLPPSSRHAVVEEHLSTVNVMYILISWFICCLRCCFWIHVASFFKETLNGLLDWQLATQGFTTPAIQFFAQSPRVARLLKQSLSQVIQGPHHKTTPWTLLLDYWLCSRDFWTGTNLLFCPKILKSVLCQQ